MTTETTNIPAGNSPAKKTKKKHRVDLTPELYKTLSKGMGQLREAGISVSNAVNDFLTENAPAFEVFATARAKEIPQWLQHSYAKKKK